jgi:hypothetical protein
MLAFASARFARAALATRRFSTSVLSNAQLLSNDSDKTFIGGFVRSTVLVPERLHKPKHSLLLPRAASLPLHPSTRYSNTGFLINNCEVQGSIFATPKLFLMWEPNAVEEILPSHLELLTLLHPKPGL